jgi:hypothetical protein
VSVLSLLLACTSEAPDAVLAYVRDEDAAGYTIAPRALPELTDPRTMSGTLGDVRHGGRIVGTGTAEHYTGGRALTVRFVEKDGVAVPLDQDGLLVYSFYGHLADAVNELDAHGVDTSPIFPIDLAWNPAVSPLLELSPADNAAYAIGANLFLLLPDGDDRDVPLLANAGVVTHELGHALLHLLMVGDPLMDPIVTDATTLSGMWQASLHEGFADSLAVLLLDDARFLDASIVMPAREVDADAALTTALLPNPLALEGSLLPVYDPYPLGTVFASVVWDIRLATDDPGATLDLLLRGVRAWAPEDEGDIEGGAFLSALVGAADPGLQYDAACAAIGARVGDLLVVDGCP